MPQMDPSVVHHTCGGKGGIFEATPYVSWLSHCTLCSEYRISGVQNTHFFAINSHLTSITRSPDCNGAIEKTWRECQVRVLARAGEIGTRVDMIRVIKEEWAGLEFERTERWCGINALVGNFVPCLKEIVENGGWDTSYM